MYKFMFISSSVRGIRTIVKQKPDILVRQLTVGLKCSSSYHQTLYRQTSGHDVYFNNQNVARSSCYQYRQYSSESVKKPNMSIPIAAGIIAAVGFIGAVMYARSKNEDREDGGKPGHGRKGAQLLDDDAKAVGHIKLPDQAQYLIVGAGTAAMSATKAIRTNDPTAKVLNLLHRIYLNICKNRYFPLFNSVKYLYYNLFIF
ncbi:hypothetical protein LSH36_38g04040 [Paralvinella palmiformis]|uniref:Uncharacterized protein n=1 Tax=Paralvinella palmiformis TaxID=53620 RepID=A0AAD9NDR6_9ANNE|nr:hypothetical protein LSH36_38g04040 [Paralvinella palmiformis]